MAAFKFEIKNWVEYRKLPNIAEADFHWTTEENSGGFYENMDRVYSVALNSLQVAQNAGKKYVLFTHGWSTYRPGRISSRSQIRELMRSKDAR